MTLRRTLVLGLLLCYPLVSIVAPRCPGYLTSVWTTCDCTGRQNLVLGIMSCMFGDCVDVSYQFPGNLCGTDGQGNQCYIPQATLGCNLPATGQCTQSGLYNAIYSTICWQRTGGRRVAVSVLIEPSQRKEITDELYSSSACSGAQHDGDGSNCLPTCPERNPSPFLANGITRIAA